LTDASISANGPLMTVGINRCVSSPSGAVGRDDPHAAGSDTMEAPIRLAQGRAIAQNA
jgi:hypothetical protein